MDQLNLLLFASGRYGLGDARNIIRILGITDSDVLDDRFRQWDTERDALMEATKTILKLKTVDYPDKLTYVQKVKAFCDHTRQLNESYTAAVLSELGKRLPSPVAA